jgi:hypothetical protein
LNDDEAKIKAKEFSKVMEKWDDPRLAADLLYTKLGGKTL